MTSLFEGAGEERELRRRIGLWLAILVVLTYLPVVGNDFVDWDDDLNFVANEGFRGFGPAQWSWSWTTFWLGVYQPLGWMICGLEWSLWGLKPQGYHAFSVALMAGVAVALFRLSVALLNRCPPAGASPRSILLGSGLATALFVAHPLRVEVVAWVSCQSYLPCALFALLATHAYVTRAPGAGQVGSRWWWVPSLALFVAALLCKAVAAALPVALVALDVYPLRRLGSGRWRWREVVRLALEKVPFFAVSLAFLAIALKAKASAGTLAGISQVGLPERVAQACLAIVTYLIQTAAPLHIINYNPGPWPIRLSDPKLVASMAAVVTITALAFGLRKRWPALPGAWCVFLAFLAPNLGLVRLDDRLTSDRYSFLASIGFALALAGLLAKVDPRRGRPIWAIGLILTALLAWASSEQCRTWRNSLALWTHAYRHGASEASAVHFGLGLAESARGREDAARAWYLKALATTPEDPRPMHNLGVMALGQGRFDEAIGWLRKAVATRPHDAAARRTLGFALAESGRLAEAETELAAAVRLQPDFVDALDRLGQVRMRLGRPREALDAWDRAAGLKPDDVGMAVRRGRAQLELGNPESAESLLNEFLARHPEASEARYLWGLALERLGKPDRAVAAWIEVIRTAPEHVEARRALAGALAKRSDPGAAEAQRIEVRRLERRPSAPPGTDGR